MGSNAFPLFQPAASPSSAGSNQFGNYATGSPSVGVVPQQSNTQGVGIPPAQGLPTSGLIKQGTTGVSTQLPMFPGLSTSWADYLQSQIGQGVQPFDLSTYLPSTGTTTAPGQLNAPLTPLLQQMQQFYSGNPATQVWQNMLSAENQNTQQNAANLREQYAFAGNLDATPFATAMNSFYNQNTLNQNSQLSQMQLSMAQGATQLGQYMQGLDQQSIQNMLTEFIRDSPQNSPYSNMLMSLATTFPPMTGQLQSGLSQAVNAIGTLLG